jgi:flagellin-like protein
MNKKGIEPIIATVLLIVIVIVAVALVIAFIIPMIQNNMDKAKSCSDARIEVVSACKNTSNFLNLRIGRGSEEFNLTGITIQFSDESTTASQKIKSGMAKPTWMLSELVIPNQFEQRTYIINLEGIHMITTKSVSIAPIVSYNNKEITCDATPGTPISSCA